MSRVVGTHRYELRALALIVRYLPVFVGVVLSTAFSLSVLRDNADIAKIAYTTGAELLGMYGGFGAVVLPFLFFATGLWRRGTRATMSWAELDATGGVTIDLASGKRVTLPRERIRSAYACPGPGGLTRVSLELEGGLTDGDRMVLDLEPFLAEPIAKRFASDAAKFDLARDGMAFGALINVAAIVGGAAIAGAIVRKLIAAGIELGIDTAALEAGSGSWGLGLTVAAAGFLHAALSLVTSPPTVAIGVDGVRIEGLFRRRFLPYRDITSVRRTRTGIELGVRGHTVSIFAPSVGAERISALLATITERAATAEHAPDSHRDVAPSVEGVRAVRAAIERSLEPTSYRVAPETDAALAEALLAPGLDRRARLATAATLAARGTREPIRVAALAVADDTTRLLLERLAEEEADLASIEAAMERAR